LNILEDKNNNIQIQGLV